MKVAGTRLLAAVIVTNLIVAALLVTQLILLQRFTTVSAYWAANAARWDHQRQVLTQNQRGTLTLLRAICINTSKTGQDVATCLAPPDTVAIVPTEEDQR